MSVGYVKSLLLLIALLHRALTLPTNDQSESVYEESGRRLCKINLNPLAVCLLCNLSTNHSHSRCCQSTQVQLYCGKGLFTSVSASNSGNTETIEAGKNRDGVEYIPSSIAALVASSSSKAVALKSSAQAALSSSDIQSLSDAGISQTSLSKQETSDHKSLWPKMSSSDEDRRSKRSLKERKPTPRRRASRVHRKYFLGRRDLNELGNDLRALMKAPHHMDTKDRSEIDTMGTQEFDNIVKALGNDLKAQIKSLHSSNDIKDTGNKIKNSKSSPDTRRVHFLGSDRDYLSENETDLKKNGTRNFRANSKVFANLSEK